MSFLLGRTKRKNSAGKPSVDNRLLQRLYAKLTGVFTVCAGECPLDSSSLQTFRNRSNYDGEPLKQDKLGFDVVGAPVPRAEGADKVSGRTVYTADVHLPGMLWGKILRSPYPMRAFGMWMPRKLVACPV